MDSDIIDRLYEVIEQRKAADPRESYVAGLHSQGVEKISQKVGEESVELIIEALKGDMEKARSESADLFFHMMVLWSHLGIRPCDVFAVLEDRFGIGGLEEKASRG